MKKNRGKIIYWILALLLLYLSIQLLLPGYIARQVKEEIRENTQQVEELSVEVKVFPVWKLLFSRADQVNVRAKEITVDGLLLENINAYYRDLKIKDGKIIGENMDLRIMISEEAFNNYLHGLEQGYENFKIKLSPEQVFLDGFLNFFGSRFIFQLSGFFRVEAENRILFMPDSIKIEDLAISQSIIDNFIGGLDLGFAFDLEKLAFPIRIEKIIIGSGRIKLLGGEFKK